MLQVGTYERQLQLLLGTGWWQWQSRWQWGSYLTARFLRTLQGNQYLYAMPG